MAERDEFFLLQPELAGLNLIFIDESGCHPEIGPLRGWAKKGERLTGPEQPYARGKHVTIIGALCAGGILAHRTVLGGMKSSDFLDFIKLQLIPRLCAGDIVCLDHLNIHKSHKVAETIESAGAQVLFLPRYSPDLNPIEAAWAKVKHIIRKLAPKTVKALRSAMRKALRSITTSDAQGWFEYCGFQSQDF